MTYPCSLANDIGSFIDLKVILVRLLYDTASLIGSVSTRVPNHIHPSLSLYLPTTEPDGVLVNLVCQCLKRKKRKISEDEFVFN